MGAFAHKFVDVCVFSIGRNPGFHSTPGIWGAFAGLPGVAAGIWVNEWTHSDAATDVSMFLGNWLLWFGIFEAAAFLKRKFSH